LASNYPAEGRSAGEGGDEPVRPAGLPSRAAGPGRQRDAEARAELRDRQAYYADLRLAVHGQSRSQPVAPRLPAPRAPLGDRRPDTWTKASPGDHAARRIDDETWDELVARFGDTWT
jgi:hypothetical protein